MKKSNKIIIITECPYSWIFKAILMYSKKLKEKWYYITYLFPDNSKNRYWETQNENESILEKYWEVSYISLNKKYTSILKDTNSLKKYIKEVNYGFIINFWSYSWKITRILYFLWKIKNLYHVPSCIQTKRFTLKYKIIELFFEKILAKKSDYYLACWSSELFLLNNFLKIDSKKILFLPNFIEFKNLNFKEKDIDFIYLWRLVKDKWIEKILNTFDVFKNYNLTILWDGYDFKKLKNKYDKFNFLWRIEFSEVWEYLKRSKFFVSFSVMEWLPFSLIEAMSFWVIPIVSNVEWHKDLIINWYNWFLFNNELDFFNIIFKINLLDEKMLENISLNAINSIKKLEDIWNLNFNKIF